MKVLLLNGSPHENGCVFTALAEVAGTLEKNSVHSEIFWIGSELVRGCIGCRSCKDVNAGKGCVFKDELYISLIEKMKESDGPIIGAPVYFAGPPGSLCALLARICFSAGFLFLHKPAACIVNCRRGGASAAFERLKNISRFFKCLWFPVSTGIPPTGRLRTKFSGIWKDFRLCGLLEQIWPICCIL